MDGFGRKTVLVFCQVLAGATCIIAGFIPEDMDGIIVALSLAGMNCRRNLDKYIFVISRKI